LRRGSSKARYAAAVPPVRSGLIVDVGPRIRALRIARGLTQAQLAEPQYTKAYISMLESGRTRASMKALEHIGGRLGVRPADLLATGGDPDKAELQLVEAERLLLEDRVDEARAMFAALDGLRADSEARRLCGLARCALNSGDWRTAIPLLERAARAYEALKDFEGGLRAKILLASAQRTHSPEDAIRMYREALAMLGAGKIIDRGLEFEAVAELAAAYQSARQEKRALSTYERALLLAEELVDFGRLAEAHADVSARYRKAGDSATALRHGQQSLHLREALRYRETVAAMLESAAALFAEQGERARARQLLDRAATLARDTGNAALLAAVQVGQAELAAADGAPDAVARAQEALRRARRAEDHRSVVRALALIAELRASENLPAAKRAFGEARAHAEANASETLPEVYERWSEALERAGEAEEALRFARLALDATRGRHNGKPS
jgi:tetratricopeptide (TPR) repeat protein